MTKKHFKRAAEMIRAERNLTGVLHKVAALDLEDFCVRLFKEFNPRFDEDKFREACRKEGA